MWNLIKGVFRSLSKNKIAIIGMSFLIFVSIATYTVLTSTTSSINRTYKKICSDSNLHDFTVNELYKTSNPVFELYNGTNPELTDQSFTSVGYASDLNDDGNPCVIVPWAIDNTLTSEVYTRTYRFALNYYSDSSNDGSAVWEFWDDHKDLPQYTDLLYPLLTIHSSVDLTYRIASSNYNGLPVSSENHNDINTELSEVSDDTKYDNHGKSEQKLIDDFINEKEQELIDFVTNTDTPMQEYMNGLKNNGQIDDYRKFRALNITSSNDSIYYKIVQSNQEDKIDKITTFNNYKNLRSTNFSSNLDPSQHRDYNPLSQFNDATHNYGNLLLARTDKNDGSAPAEDVLHCPLPDSWTSSPTPNPSNPNYVNNYAAYIEAKILLLSLSNDTYGIDDVYKDDLLPLVKALTQKNPIHWARWELTVISHNGRTLKDCYDDFVDYIKPSKEVVYNKGYRFVIQWQEGSGTIYSWQMDLFTSKFAFVNPQYLKANKAANNVSLKPLDASLYENNASYKTYKNNHGGSASLEDWLNSIPYKNDSDANETNINKTTTFSSWFDLICKNYPQYTVASSSSSMQTPYIILGSAITANFMYPIVSLDHLIPNPKKECIIFTNTQGYQRINDAFRSSEVESYLVAKFKSGTNKNDVLNSINDYANNPARQTMMYPSNIKIAYMNSDTSNVLSPAALRIAFIPKLINNLTIADTAVVIFILILALLICMFVINNYISKRRVEIGIMRANGIKRRKIVFSLLPFAFIPAVIGSIVGYFVGFSLQFATIGLFHNYWSIPTTLVGFNLWTLIVSIFIPFLISFAISSITTVFVLRKSTVKLLKSDGEYKSNVVSRYINRPFAKFGFGIMTKFRVSLAFNFIWKLLVLSIMSALAMSSIIFAMSINGKFEESKNVTYASQKYNYAVDLYSPTTQGGQYIPYDSSYIGQNGFVKSVEGTNFIPNNMYDDNPADSYNPGDPNDKWPIDNSYYRMFGNTYYDTNNPIHLSKQYYENQTFNQFKLLDEYRRYVYEYNDNDVPTNWNYQNDDSKCFANVLYPNTDDGVGQQIDINYLKNRSMTKSFLNLKVGFSQMSTNPWGIATSLMPENNKNTADSKTNELINKAGIKANTIGDPWYNMDLPEDPYHYPDTGDKTIKSLFSIANVGGKQMWVLNKDEILAPLGSAISENLLWFEHILYSDKTIFNNEEAGNLDYNIQYNQVPLNDDDETYTYLSATGLSKKIKDDDIRIVGLKQLDNGSISNKCVTLLDKNGNDISNLISVNDTKSHPMIINAYAAKQHNLRVGDTIQVNINNKSDRFDKQLNPSGTFNNTTTFKIVGINQTYQNEEYFISQELANSLLGLRNHLPDGKTQNVNNWYYDYGKGKGITTGMSGLEFAMGLDSNPDGYDESLARTYNLSNLQNLGQEDLNGLDVNEDKCNLTPYGFNGVFTKSDDGGLLNNGFYLYSPSGLYPASDSFNSESVKNVMKFGANTEVANEIIFNNDFTSLPTDSPGKEIHDAYTNYYNVLNQNGGDGDIQAVKDAFKALRSYSEHLIILISSTFGDTAYRQLVNNVVDKNGMQSIYNDLSNTVSAIEVALLTCITILVFLIVILISELLINNAKRLGAILKALGYSDISCLNSFVSVYIPAIIFGLIIAIPLGILLVFGFTNIIFSAGGILLTSTIKWWYYLVGIAGVLGLLSVSGLLGYYELTKESLVKRLKTDQ